MQNAKQLADLRSRAETMRTKLERTRGAYELAVAKAKKLGITSPKVGKEKIVELESRLAALQKAEQEIIVQIEEALQVMK